MNDFNETFVLAFYNSSLKIELNCYKENISFVVFERRCCRTWQAFHLLIDKTKWVLEDSFKDSCDLKIF